MILRATTDLRGILLFDRKICDVFVPEGCRVVLELQVISSWVRFICEGSNQSKTQSQMVMKQ